jgi:hypothetical protein
MTDEDRKPPYRASCSLTRRQLPPPNQAAAGRLKLQPFTGLRIKAHVDLDPPPRTHRPWVDDPRFGLKDG